MKKSRVSSVLLMARKLGYALRVPPRWENRGAEQLCEGTLHPGKAVNSPTVLAASKG